MSEEQVKSRSGGQTTMIVALALLPLVYVLSIGPAVVIADKYPGSGTERALKIFYAPIIWLHDKTPLRRPLENYVEFFARMSRRRSCP